MLKTARLTTINQEDFKDNKGIIRKCKWSKKKDNINNGSQNTTRKTEDWEPLLIQNDLCEVSVFTPVLIVVRVVQSLVFCVMFCR
jgi:hypothetical protein